jgi:hypothetical protein
MSELLRLRDQVKKAEIRYLEKVSKTGARGLKKCRRKPPSVVG